jgi:hypothetical protein
MTWPVTPGMPIAGHMTAKGFWHPGRSEGCQKCPERVAPQTGAPQTANGTFYVDNSGWFIKYTGGRLGDIYWGGQPEAVHCISVVDEQKWEAQPYRATRAEVQAALREWIDSDEPKMFYDNVVRYR